MNIELDKESDSRRHEEKRGWENERDRKNGEYVRHRSVSGPGLCSFLLRRRAVEVVVLNQLSNALVVGQRNKVLRRKKRLLSK